MVTDLRVALQDIVGARYRIEREMPQGGMSRLFLAEEPELGRRVVIKVLPPELACRASVGRFRREIDVMVQLQHPHILPVLAGGGHDDVLYYVTPYVDGETLRQRLAREGALPVAEAARLLGEIVDVVAFAHASGVAHRDLKPENVFIVDGVPVLADFGIARALDVPPAGGGGAPSPHPGPALRGRVGTGGLTLAEEVSTSFTAALTGNETTVGTPGYIPPEGWADPLRGDVYALAVLGVELLTGRRGLPLAPPAVAAARARPRGAAAALGLPAGTPPALAVALARGLSADPAARFASAVELREALARVRKQDPAVRWRAVLLGVAAGCAAYAAVWLAPAPVQTFDDDRIAVVPFDASQAGLRALGAEMSEALYHYLDGAGPFHTVSPSAFVRDWHGPADGDAALAVARRTGARWVVTGHLGAIPGGRVRVQTRAYDARTRGFRIDFEQTGSAEYPELLPDSVMIGLLAEFNAIRPIRAVSGRQPRLGARSLPAYKAFLRGEQFYRRNQWDSAQGYYERAVEHDSTFALALGRMRGVLRRHDEFSALSLDYALRAGRFNKGLGVKDSLRLEADSVLAAVSLRPEGAPGRVADVRRIVALLERAAARDSADADVWTQFGEALYHVGPDAGQPYARAVPALRHALAADPGFAPAYYHAIELAPWAEGTSGALRLVRQYNALDGGDSTMRAVQDVLAHGAHALPRVDALPADQRGRAEYLLHRWVDPTDAAISLTRRLVADSALATQSYGSVAVGRRVLALDLLYRGRVRETAAGLTPADLAANPAIVTLLSDYEALPREQIARLASAWARARDVSALAIAAPALARAHETAALEALARLCAGGAARRTPAGDPNAGPDCVFGAVAARGYLAIARGDTAGAVDAFRAIPDTVCIRWCAAERAARAELLARAGHAAEAASLLERFPPQSRRTGLPISRWLLARARVAGRAGDHASAAAFRRDLSAPWAHADSAVRHWLADVPRSD